MDRRSFLKLLLAVPVAAVVAKLPELVKEQPPATDGWASYATATPIADFRQIQIMSLKEYGGGHNRVYMNRATFKILADSGNLRKLRQSGYKAHMYRG